MARPKTGTELHWKEVFLNALREQPVVKYACNRAGVSRTAAYNARKKSEANPTEDNFAERWDDCMESGLDQVEIDLLKLGRGEMKGNVAALIYYLKVRRYEVRQGNDMPAKLTLEWGNTGDDN